MTKLPPRTSLQLDPKLVMQAKILAISEGRTLTNVIEDLLRKYYIMGKFSEKREGEQTKVTFISNTTIANTSRKKT